MLAIVRWNTCWATRSTADGSPGTWSCPERQQVNGGSPACSAWPPHVHMSHMHTLAGPFKCPRLWPHWMKGTGDQGQSLEGQTDPSAPRQKVEKQGEGALILFFLKGFKVLQKFVISTKKTNSGHDYGCLIGPDFRAEQDNHWLQRLSLHKYFFIFKTM